MNSPVFPGSAANAGHTPVSLSMRPSSESGTVQPGTGAEAASAKPRRSFEDELDDLFAEPLPGSSRRSPSRKDLPQGILGHAGKPTSQDLGEAQRLRHDSTAAPAIRLSTGSLMDHGDDDGFAPTELHAGPTDMERVDSRSPLGTGWGGPAVPGQMQGGGRSDANAARKSKSKSPSAENQAARSVSASGNGKKIGLAVAALAIVAVCAGAWLALQPSSEALVQQRVNQPSGPGASSDEAKAQAVTGPLGAGLASGIAPAGAPAQENGAAATASASPSDPLVVLPSAPVAQTVVGATLSDAPAAGITPVAAGAVRTPAPARVPVQERRKPQARNLDSLLD